MPGFRRAKLHAGAIRRCGWASRAYQESNASCSLHGVSDAHTHPRRAGTTLNTGLPTVDQQMCPGKRAFSVCAPVSRSGSGISLGGDAPCVVIRHVGDDAAPVGVLGLEAAQIARIRINGDATAESIPSAAKSKPQISPCGPWRPLTFARRQALPLLSLSRLKPLL